MKNIFFTFLSLALMQAAIGQGSGSSEFNHGIGIKYFGYGGTDQNTSYGLVYSPKINVARVGESGSVSVGTRLSAGVNFHNDAVGSFMYEVPLLTELNFGMGAWKENQHVFGVYLGGGYGIHNITASKKYNLKAYKIAGPVLSAGLRFNVPRGFMAGNWELGGNYMIDTKNSYTLYNPYGISLTLLMGIDEFY